MHPIVNPNDVAFYDTLFLMTFGAIGSTQVYVYADHLGSALEEVADWLAEHAPGHLTALDDPQIEELTDKETGEVSDMTYTEAGYITSYEWWGSEVDDHSKIDAHCRWLGEWIEDQEVCTDCVMMLANGEDTTEHGDHAEAMERWQEEGFDLVLTGNEASFSWRQCDGCGSNMGGDRHDAVWIPRRK